MLGFIIRRIVWTIPVLLLVILMTFIMMKIIKGNPFQVTDRPVPESIQRNLDYLDEVLRTGRWPMLRRDPPCFTWERNPVQNIRSLVIGQLKQVWKSS